MPAREMNDFWAADEALKTQVIKTLASTGAVAIVTEEELPDFASPPEWQRVGDTDYSVYLLRR